MTTADDSRSILLVLGAGATVGSGYQCLGETPPIQDDFFKKLGEQERDACAKPTRENAPALCHLLAHLWPEAPSKPLDSLQDLLLGMEEAWNLVDLSYKYHDNYLHDWSMVAEGFESDFARKVSEEDSEGQYSRYYDGHWSWSQALCILAGWEMRILTTRLFSGLSEASKATFFNKFFEKMCKAKERTDLTILTFNYDLSVEKTLQALKVPYHYPIIEPVKKDSVEIIKIHGSLNWVHDRARPDIFLTGDQEALKAEDQGYKRQGNLGEWKFKQNAIVGPVSFKGEINLPNRQDPICRVLIPLFRRTVRRIAEAKKIVFIGYSLPVADFYTRWLFSKGLSEQEKPCEVFYCDKETCRKRVDIQQKQLRSLFGKMIVQEEGKNETLRCFHNGLERHMKDILEFIG